MNMTVIELGDGIKRLIPDKGFRLYNALTRKFYSIAEVRDISPYTAVKEE